MKLIKHLVVGILIAACFSMTARAQNPNSRYQNDFFTTGTAPANGIPLNVPINYVALTWSDGDGVATCSVTLDTSTNNVSWTIGGGIPAQNCATGSGSAIYNISPPAYVRINVSTLTGSGSVLVTYYGYTNSPSGGTGTSVTVNGGSSLTTANFNSTTPAAGGNNQNLVFQNSSTNISVEVPLATTGQAGIVALAEDLGGTSASPQVVGLNDTNLAALASGFLYNSTGTGVPSTVAGSGTGNVCLVNGCAINLSGATYSANTTKIDFFCSTATPTGTTYCGQAGAGTAPNTTQSVVQSPTDMSGTLTSWYCRVSAAEGASSTLTLTLQVAGSSTTATGTIANSSSTFSRVTGLSVAIPADSLVNILLSQSGTGTLQNIWCSGGMHP